MKTDYNHCWPVLNTQADAGLPGGPLKRQPYLRPAIRWHLVILGVGIGLMLVGLLT